MLATTMHPMAFAVGFLGAALAQPVPSPPATVDLPTSSGAVLLPHKAHSRRIACGRCHGEGTPRRIQGFGKERAHALCRGCHDSRRNGPRGCADCHKRGSTNASAQPPASTTSAANPLLSAPAPRGDAASSIDQTASEGIPVALRGRWEALSRACGSEAGASITITRDRVAFHHGAGCSVATSVSREAPNGVVLEVTSASADPSCPRAWLRLMSAGRYLGRDELQVDDFEMFGDRESGSSCWYVRAEQDAP